MKKKDNEPFHFECKLTLDKDLHRYAKEQIETAIRKVINKHKEQKKEKVEKDLVITT